MRRRNRQPDQVHMYWKNSYEYEYFSTSNRSLKMKRCELEYVILNEDTDISNSAEGNYRDPSESRELSLKWILFIDIHWGRCPTVKPFFIGGESEELFQYEMTPEEGLEKSVEREESNWWHQAAWAQYVPTELRAEFAEQLIVASNLLFKMFFFFWMVVKWQM